MSKIIAVDFDGTLCENEYPEIGAPKKDVIGYILEQQKKNDAKLILWTNRSGEYLDKAIYWCLAYGIRFDEINKNLPEIIKKFGNDCRKIFANEYIDDKAIHPSQIVKVEDVEETDVDEQEIKDMLDKLIEAFFEDLKGELVCRKD